MFPAENTTYYSVKVLYMGENHVLQCHKTEFTYSLVLKWIRIHLNFPLLKII